MEFIKNSLTLREMLQFVKRVVDNCFVQDEKGTDIEYTPAFKNIALKEAVAIFFTDYSPTDNFETNYELYKDLDYSLADVGGDNFAEILKAIDDEIDFRKQKMLQSDNSISKYITELLQLQIENQKLQKKVLQQTEKLNKQFSPAEIKTISENIGILNQNMKNAEVQKGLVEAIDTVKPFKRSEDQKLKSQNNEKKMKI
jgi:hypothetical protein